MSGKRDTLPAYHPLVVACDDMSIDAANDERLFVCTLFMLMRYCVVDIVIVVDERVSITVSALNVGILQRMYCVSLSIIV